ncbi:hypothetical protein Msi02_44290 [Microbispora siamensis]|uniref:Uncharacterized protein n=1 Tax=Microbispora siamensis TaxID=564413 RepID=A0ABQ4GQA3_9ACTN|nr:hypothetical protein Msi02_44290 [Microbispora siamensis]
MRVLQRDVLADRAEIVAQVKRVGGGLDTGQDASKSHTAILSGVAGCPRQTRPGGAGSSPSTGRLSPGTA